VTTQLHLVSRLRMRVTIALPHVFNAWCLIKHRGNFTFKKYENFHVNVGPCRHGMACSRVADGADRL
jgi:hypothetical protein